MKRLRRFVLAGALVSSVSIVQVTTPPSGNSPSQLPAAAALASQPVGRVYLPRLVHGDPRRLTYASHVGGTAGPLAAQEDRLYVGKGPHIHVYDVSSPLDAARLGTSPALSGNVGALVIDDDLLLAGVPGAIAIFNIGSAGPLRFVADIEVGVPISGPLSSLTVGDGWVAAPGVNGPVIIGISDPEAPTVLFAATREDPPLGAYQRDVVTAEDHIYAATGEGLEVFDVSLPSEPVRTAVRAEPRGARQVALDDDILWVLSWRSLRAFSLEDPSEPLEVGRLEIDGGASLASTEDQVLLWLSGDDGPRLLLVDASDPAHPRTLARVAVDGELALNGHMLWSDAWVYATDYSAGVRVLDMTNPEALRQVAVFAGLNGSSAAAPISNGVAMLQGSRGRLVTVAPQSGDVIASIPSQAVGLAAVDDVLVAVGAADIGVFTAESPGHMRLERTLPLGGRPLDLAVTRERAVVALSDRVVGINIAQPEKPELDFEIALDPTYSAKWVALGPDHAWVLERVDPGVVAAEPGFGWWSKGGPILPAAAAPGTGKAERGGTDQWSPPWRLHAIHLDSGQWVWTTEGDGWGVGGLALSPETRTLVVGLGAGLVAYDVSDASSPVELGVVPLTPGETAAPVVRRAPVGGPGTRSTRPPRAPEAPSRLNEPTRLSGSEGFAMADGHLIVVMDGYIGAWRLTDPMHPEWAGAVPHARQFVAAMASNGEHLTLEMGDNGVALLDLRRE